MASTLQRLHCGDHNLPFEVAANATSDQLLHRMARSEMRARGLPGLRTPEEMVEQREGPAPAGGAAVEGAPAPEP
eukprot:1273046-Rhodomonas_salina.1